MSPPRFRPAAGTRRLQAQNEALVALFEARGFRRIHPPVLQPADVFIERSGEMVRARTFLFADPDGIGDLCLRPDLTVPTCRHHLAETADPRREARYAYLGPVFRYHAGDDPLFPDEWQQAGVEWFGHEDRARADATILDLALEAVRAAGLSAPRLVMGDVGLLSALLADMDMPARWRRRLLRRFRRPQAFHETLAEMAGARPRPLPPEVAHLVQEIAALPDEDLPEAARDLVARRLGEMGLSVMAGRDVADIARRLAEKAEELRLPPLSPGVVDRIEAFLRIAGTPQEALHALAELTDADAGLFAGAVEICHERLRHLATALDGLAGTTFAADFGRDFEYYTGLVFQIEAEIDGRWLPVAGGGRYDNLVAGLGGPDVPACGFGIHTERLLLAAGEGAS